MPPGISYSFAAGIKKGGKMKLRIFDVSKDLGFELDNEGKLKIEE